MDHVEDRVRELQSLLRRDPEPDDAARTLAQLRALLENMARDGNLRHHPIREIFARLGDKWSTLLLLLLDFRPYRHATLWRLVGAVAGDGQISQRILRLRLRALERDGLITHATVPGKSPGVRYEITDLGHELVAHIQLLHQWVRDHMAEIRAAQERHAAPRQPQPRNRRMPSS